MYLSYLSEDDHGTVIADSRDTGEQHCLLVVFAEGLDFLCGLRLFMEECLHNVQVTGEAVLFGIRECNVSEESYSSWAEQVAVLAVLYSVAK